MNNIEKTIKFIQDLFENSEYLKDKKKDRDYRLNHTYRVASIGKEIALKEKLDVDALVIGCLLHDISYVTEMKNDEERRAHGRLSAKMAREFVYSLDVKQHLKDELLYGVAIHVDDKSDFEGDRTVLAETISECDNIDRFDKYRLYEHLHYSDLDSKTLEEQLEYAEKRIKGLNRLKREFIFKTKTSNSMWNDNLDYQIDYFERLLKQLKTSDYKNLT